MSTTIDLIRPQSLVERDRRYWQEVADRADRMAKRTSSEVSLITVEQVQAEESSDGIGYQIVVYFSR